LAHAEEVRDGVRRAGNSTSQLAIRSGSAASTAMPCQVTVTDRLIARSTTLRPPRYYKQKNLVKIWEFRKVPTGRLRGPFATASITIASKSSGS